MVKYTIYYNIKPHQYHYLSIRHCTSPMKLPGPVYLVTRAVRSAQQTFRFLFATANGSFVEQQLFSKWHVNLWLYATWQTFNSPFIPFAPLNGGLHQTFAERKHEKTSPDEAMLVCCSKHLDFSFCKHLLKSAWPIKEKKQKSLN